MLSPAQTTIWHPEIEYRVSVPLGSGLSHDLVEQDVRSALEDAGVYANNAHAYVESNAPLPGAISGPGEEHLVLSFLSGAVSSGFTYDLLKASLASLEEKMGLNIGVRRKAPGVSQLEIHFGDYRALVSRVEQLEAELRVLKDDALRENSP